MKQCPHASGKYGCNALRDNGFAQNALVIPENWSKIYCSGKNYYHCPNLKTAVSMRQDRKQEQLGASYSGTDNNNKIDPYNKQKSSLNHKKPKGVHAHGDKPPHYCEKPWRSKDIRFRVTVSDFYTKPWYP